MIVVRSGVFTKLAGTLLRLLVGPPALMHLTATIEVFWRQNAWLAPISAFWMFPVFGGIFAMLCLIPYGSNLFQGKRKIIFLVVILIVCSFEVRHRFFPFYYASTGLSDRSELFQEFQDAKLRPGGSGFISERREHGKVLWFVRKPNYALASVVIFGGFCLTPVLLFLLRNYEVQHGITWRSLLAPKEPHPRIGVGEETRVSVMDK